MAQEDHDILIELKTRMEDVRKEIRELASGTHAQIADHEARLKKLETFKGVLITNTGLAWGAWGIVLTVILYHVFK